MLFRFIYQEQFECRKTDCRSPQTSYWVSIFKEIYFNDPFSSVLIYLLFDICNSFFLTKFGYNSWLYFWYYRDHTLNFVEGTANAPAEADMDNDAVNNKYADGEEAEFDDADFWDSMLRWA